MQKAAFLACDHIYGVPLGAVPLATGVALNLEKPLLLVRKDQKEHGNKKMVEGCYSTGDQVMVLEDVATTGGSAMEIIYTILEEGLSVSHVMTVLDRDQGAQKLLAEKDITLHTVCTIDEALDTLYYSDKIDQKMWQEVKTWLSNQRKPHPKPLPHNLLLSILQKELTSELKALAAKHDFLIFEDRKFADIGNTVQHQYRGGIYHIYEWADLITVHALPRPDIIKALRQEGKGIFLNAQMSSKGNLATPAYTEETLKMARANADTVMGVICRKKVFSEPHFLHLIPGVNLETKGDALGQQYLIVNEAIVKKGCDVVIVGRGVYHAEDSQAAAALYRSETWSAYQEVLTR